jgi:hypothetical protein
MLQKQRMAAWIHVNDRAPVVRAGFRQSLK